MKKDHDMFFVANTTAYPGWCVYRKTESQTPRDTSRWWVRLIPDQGGIIGERISIPRGCVRLRTRELHKAARAASVFNTGDRLESDCIAAVKAQRQFLTQTMKEIYDTP